jgi:hypothetical protein
VLSANTIKKKTQSSKCKAFEIIVGQFFKKKLLKGKASVQKSKPSPPKLNRGSKKNLKPLLI